MHLRQLHQVNFCHRRIMVKLKLHRNSIEGSVYLQQMQCFKKYCGNQKMLLASSSLPLKP